MHGLPEPDTGVIALKNEIAMPFGESTNSSWLRADRGQLLQRPHRALVPEYLQSRALDQGAGDRGHAQGHPRQ
jgi:hypothetical protein